MQYSTLAEYVAKLDRIVKKDRYGGYRSKVDGCKFLSLSEKRVKKPRFSRVELSTSEPLTKAGEAIENNFKHYSELGKPPNLYFYAKHNAEIAILLQRLVQHYLRDCHL